MKVFNISGHFTIDEPFYDYKVAEFDNTPANYSDDDIFFYGLSEDQIKEAIKTKEPIDDFIIESYTVYDHNA